jgi:hypothetical protein
MGDYKSKFNIVERRNFNPESYEDLMELGFFVKNKKWKNGCPFHLEFPYSDVPAMCMAKYTEHSLG